MSPHELDTNDLYEKFSNMGATKFVGVDPPEADEWLVQMENVFKVLRCTGCQKISVACYMFRGIVDTSWRSV